MNLRQIEVFRAVMHCGSVSGAAVQLHVSAPAVSRLISHLELRLGVRLFERRSSRLLPTAEAQALMREVESAYHHVDRVRQFAATLPLGGAQPLRVCTNLSTALELVPRAAAALLQRLPQLRIKLELGGAMRIREVLEAGEQHIGVGAFLESDGSALERLPIGQGTLQLALAADHRLCRRASVPRAALAHERLVAYDAAGPHGQQLRRALALPDQVAPIEVPFAYMACAMVACGVGVAVVDDLTLRHFRQAGVEVRAIEPPLEYRVEALVDAQRPVSAAARALVETLRAQWREMVGAAPPHSA